VFKPAEDAPLIAMRLVEILLEAGLPAGALSLVHGLGEEAGRLWFVTPMWRWSRSPGHRR